LQLKPKSIEDLRIKEFPVYCYVSTWRWTTNQATFWRDLR